MYVCMYVCMYKYVLSTLHSPPHTDFVLSWELLIIKTRERANSRVQFVSFTHLLSDSSDSSHLLVKGPYNLKYSIMSQ